MKNPLFQRVRIEGREICVSETLFLDKETVTMPANDPLIPRGTYVALEFLTSTESPEPVVKMPGVVSHSGSKQMSVRLENLDSDYENLVDRWNAQP